MTPALRRTVEGSGGVRLAVTEQGPSPAPTVVLVHGYPNRSDVWDPVVDLLADRFRVVTYDVRGAGESDAPEGVEAYHLEHLVADLDAVIATVSPNDAVHLVAHDWGSIQSWEAVCTPEVAARIATFTSISGPPLDHVGRWARRDLRDAPTIRELLGQARREGYIAAMRVPGLMERAWRGALGRRWPAAMRRQEGLVDPTWPTPAALAHDGAHGANLYRANILSPTGGVRSPRRRHTDVPVQVICPVDDEHVSAALARGLEETASDLRVRDVPGGHWIVRRHPERVARWITEHIEGATRRSPAAVVTGAGSGIGRAVSLALAERGHTVVVADIDEAAAERTAVLCELVGGEAFAERVDVGDESAMESFAERVEQKVGVPAVVVNNAGIGLTGAMLDTSAQDWDQVLSVNLWGVIHGSRIFGRRMAGSGEGGHIVNIASAAAFTPSRSLAAYSTSKAAVLMMSECLRAELADDAVGVSVICPGFVDTPIVTSTRYVGVSAEEQRRRRAATARLYRRRRLGPDRVAAAVLEAVDEDHAVVKVGAEAHLSAFVARWWPGLMRRVARKELVPT